MAVLQWGCLLLLVAFLVHLLIWRVRKPAAPLKALLVILVATEVVGLTAAHLGEGVARALGLAALPGVAADLHVVLFVTSVGLVYTISYTLLEWDSPTLTIVTLIGRAGRAGISEAELLKTIDKLPFFQSRIDGLIRGGSLVCRDGRFFVGPGRHLAFRFILSYRRLLGVERRGG